MLVGFEWVWLAPPVLILMLLVLLPPLLFPFADEPLLEEVEVATGLVGVLSGEAPR